MRATVIEADGISKRYELGQAAAFLSLREVLAQAMRVSGRGARSRRPTLWALQDVSFSVREGTCFGIVGRNGSGKSTLLKILTRITDPTAGRARVRGRVGALLEIGAGFHEDLTGRENVFLSGAILGMSKRDVARRFDEIVQFSGVAPHIDTPVKRYSSGMYLRLAFSVAAHLEPDVLIVDEALSVGDAEFQRRCYEHVLGLSSSGRTIVYVSHDLHSVSRLCDEILWLDQGRMQMLGPTDDVLGKYLATVSPAAGELRVTGAPDGIDLASMTVRGTDGETNITEHSEIEITVLLDVARSVDDLEAALVIEDIDGASVVVEPASLVQPGFASQPGRYELTLTVPPAIAGGEYSAGLWVWSESAAVSPLSASLRFDIEGPLRRERRLLRLSSLRVERTGCASRW
jgi:ABC-2 type transport system ATP-binding protein/lipopolysaccharide transport system ATP-binding protein